MSSTFYLSNTAGIRMSERHKPTAHSKAGATIGADATIVSGHDIGGFAFIGAGAMVTKSVPNYALVKGTLLIKPDG